MILDLIQVLSAVFIAAIVPGYFWSKCLFPAADRAERLIYSTALSMALVPAITLIPARAFGLGVTLPAAIGSTLFVLISGFAAYATFGAAKAPEKPAAPPPPLLPATALILIVVAAGLALAASLGFSSGWLLAIAAGVLGIFAGVLTRRSGANGGRATTGASSSTATGTGSRGLPLSGLLLTVVLALVLVRGYSGPVLFDWPFIRGVDHYSHAVMTQLMLSVGTSEEYLIYPPGFHTMTAIFSRLTGLGPLEIFPVFGPLLLLLPPLALYALARRLWGPVGGACGVAAAALAGLASGGTYLYFNDAMYPNLVTSQFLLVLTIAALVRFYGLPALRTGLPVALLGSSVVLYHQVSSLYLALLLALVSVIFIPYLLLRGEWRRSLALLLAFAALGGLSVVYAWDTYNLPQIVAGLFESSETSRTGNAVGMAIGTQATYTPEQLVLYLVSTPVVWLGLLGATLLVGGLSRTEAPRTLSYLTVLLWVSVLLAGSVTSLSGFPQRFGRDLGVPLSLLAAFALVAVLRSLWVRRASLTSAPAVAAASVAALASVLVVVGVGVQSAQTLELAAAPSPQLTTNAKISAAGEWLREHNDGGNILVSPYSNQVPSRMMLAMGGYSAYQSFTLGQIQYPRDLPPGGPEPLLDVLQMIQYPGTESSIRLLREYDVRYIVLYKNMPDRTTDPDYGPAFENLPDLYEKAFENEDVVIFAPQINS